MRQTRELNLLELRNTSVNQQRKLLTACPLHRLYQVPFQRQAVLAPVADQLVAPKEP